MSVFISILVMLAMLSVLTIVHEWGHFIAARIFKVKVTEFAIFMGPRIFSHTSKKSGTVFSVRCLPLGGFCAFEDDNGNTESPDSLNSQSWWKRAIIFSAGVIMNILLALILSVIVIMFSGYNTTTLEKVDPDSTAAFIGLEAGDSLYSLNGMRTITLTDEGLASYIIQDKNSKEDVMDSEYTLVYKKADGRKLAYKVEKHAEYDNVTLENEKQGYKLRYYTYTVTEDTDGEGKKYIYKNTIESVDDTKATCNVEKIIDGEVISKGQEILDLRLVGTMGNSNFFYERTFNPIKLIHRGFNEMVSMVKSVYLSLYWIITGQVGLNAVSGPIGLTTVVEDVVSAEGAAVGLKALTLVNMAALISANLGVMNFLPFPGLDGCHMLFILIELLRGGKKIPPDKQAIVSMIGLGLLILLAVVIMGADIMRIINGESLI